MLSPKNILDPQTHYFVPEKNASECALCSYTRGRHRTPEIGDLVVSRGIGRMEKGKGFKVWVIVGIHVPSGRKQRHKSPQAIFQCEEIGFVSLNRRLDLKKVSYPATSITKAFSPDKILHISALSINANELELLILNSKKVFERRDYITRFQNRYNSYLTSKMVRTKTDRWIRGVIAEDRL